MHMHTRNAHAQCTCAMHMRYAHAQCTPAACEEPSEALEDASLANLEKQRSATLPPRARPEDPADARQERARATNGWRP